MSTQLDESTSNRELVTVSWPRCPLCGREGKLRHAGLGDRQHGTPGEWGVRVCGTCELFWLDPRPAPECLADLYPPAYFTHIEPQDWSGPGAGRLAWLRFEIRREVLHRAYGYPPHNGRRLGRVAGVIAAFIPPLRERVGYGIRFLPAGEGPLLDVGCGNGAYLLTMSRLGWDVCGTEPDAAAAALARRVGLKVEGKSLDLVSLEPNKFGAITMNHVLEHLPDPVMALQKLAGALRPGGVLVSISPNPCGLLARCFGPAWRGWEPPRHFVLLGPKAAAVAARRAGLDPHVSTIAQVSQFMAEQSWMLRRGARLHAGQWLPRQIARFCKVFQIVSRQSGEEVVLVARKP